MKRILAVLLSLMLLTVCAYAEEAPAPWYEIESNVLTVRVPVAEGQKWGFEISNPYVLELLTHEVTEDGVYVASFADVQSKAGTAVLALTLFDSENATLEVRTLDLTADETGALTPGEAITGNPVDDYRLSANPLRYDMFLVRDVFVSEYDSTLCVSGSFGAIGGFFEEGGLIMLGFDEELTYTLPLTEGMTFNMPASLDDPTELTEGEDLLAWYTDACETLGFPMSYHATFELGADGVLTALDYCYVP